MVRGGSCGGFVVVCGGFVVVRSGLWVHGFVVVCSGSWWFVVVFL